jgi:hypothetical protein
MWVNDLHERESNHAQPYYHNMFPLLLSLCMSVMPCTLVAELVSAVDAIEAIQAIRLSSIRGLAGSAYISRIFRLSIG